MKRRRSLFLLEIVIAMALVGFFSVYFLRSALQHLYKERQGLLDLEFEWQSDLHKMEMLEQAWPHPAALNSREWIDEKLKVTMDGKGYFKTYAYQLYCATDNEKGCRLTLKEKVNGKSRSYNFLVKKDEKSQPGVESLSENLKK